MSSAVACALASRLVAPTVSTRRNRPAVIAAAPRAAGAGGSEPSPSPTPPASSTTPDPPTFTTRLEHMDTLLLHKEPGGASHKYSDLDQVENELGAFCSTLSPEDSPEKCWQAYSFLERRREAATASCDWGQPDSCTDLEKLNDMAHELLATGSMDDVVATFSTLARVEEMRASRDAKKGQQQMQAEADEDVMERAFNTEEEEYLHSLFCDIDTNGDGMLSMTEFRQGMAMLGDELDENTVALIGDAMEIHGFVSEAQFKDIVEAEQINSHSEVANLWRHHRVFGKRYR